MLLNFVSNIAIKLFDSFVSLVVISLIAYLTFATAKEKVIKKREKVKAYNKYEEIDYFILI